VFEIIVESVITFIIVAAIFYVAPGVLGLMKTSAPTVLDTTDPALNSSVTSIGGVVSGGLSISSISVLLFGVGIMIAGFMMFRQFKSK
jgi:hypothetical protein